MADNHPSPWDLPVARDAVEASIGATYWSVESDRWRNLLPSLPDDVLDLLAPPIVVGATPVSPPAAETGATPAPALAAEDVLPDDGVDAIHRLKMLMFQIEPMLIPAPLRVSRGHRRPTRVA